MPFTAHQQRLMDAYYAKAKSCKDDAKAVQLVYQMIKLCKEADEAYIQQMTTKTVGIHPSNRSGKAMKDSKMHKKGIKVHRVGFAKALCNTDRAIAFEDHPIKKLCEKHTLKCTSGSKMFGQYSPGTIRVGSVGCSHLNQWLHAGNCGAETPYSEICDPGKNTMSKSIIVADNEEQKEAMDNGLYWLVMKSTLEYDYGYDELPSISSEP